MWSVPGSFLAEQAVTEQSPGSGIRKSLPKFKAAAEDQLLFQWTVG